jgi:antitoxin (DNA-binding transcriptional repressor) of toxin-antitoxin stability system
MKKLNIHEAKTHLSRHLAHLREGETIVLCKRNTPIAEIRPLPSKAQKNRPIGLAKNFFRVPASFFKPLPSSVLAFFQGEEP